MLFFGHVGITVGVVQALNHATKRKVDLRKVAVCAILPDLLDKPVALLYPVFLGNHTRLWAHSVVFTLLLYLIMKGWRRWFQYPGILAGAYFGHMVLDRIWLGDWYAFLWPALRFPPPIPTAILLNWGRAITQPWTVFGEVMGFSILCFLYIYYKLGEKQRMTRFLATGVLEAPRRKVQDGTHLSLPI